MIIIVLGILFTPKMINLIKEKHKDIRFLKGTLKDTDHYEVIEYIYKTSEKGTIDYVQISDDAPARYILTLTDNDTVTYDVRRLGTKEYILSAVDWYTNI